VAAAALIATPYAFAYDMAVIAIPAAFLASDQIRHGFLRGEQTVVIALFGTSLAALVAFGDRPGGITFGSAPIGSLVMITLLGMILRRALCHGGQPAALAYTGAAQQKPTPQRPSMRQFRAAPAMQRTQ
jgi:hypothetical protein